MPPITVSEEQANQMFPVHNEPKIMTMARPLIVQCSSPGWQMGGKRYPAVPFSIEGQAKDLADAIKAGAVAIHVHPRNPDNGLAMINSALLKRVLDATFEKVGDCVTLSHTWYPRQGGIDYIVDTEELLQWGDGNKYCQGSVVLPFDNAARANVDKGVRFLDAHNVKPLFEFYDTSAQVHFKQLIDSIGNLSKPLNLDINLGKHDSTAIHQDPGSYLNAIANLDIVQKTFPGQFYGWRTGGRNWLPIMTMGIMMGVDLVQVGLEDAYWRWPHRDELIESSAESVKWAVDIANVMGRRVVTDPNEARKIMGIKLTSKMG
ncbi:MAG: 3-keto-5-aminohexanoate cleavage protein [Gammaproteobacteria bacterium]|nr:3-keto-5-aminohexanoate cleavage protein [Gammaproteobacteria bacterium]